MKAAFDELLPPGLITFEAGRARTGARLHTRYAVHTSGSLYFHESQKSKPDIDRDYFEGVSIEWSCQLTIDELAGYDFSLHSAPENLLTVAQTSGRSGPTPQEVYEVMAASAFKDFSSELIQHFRGNDAEWFPEVLEKMSV